MAGENSQAIVDRNKRLIGRWFEEVWDKGRRDAIHELLAANCVIHDGSGKFRGPEEFARFHDGLQAEFENFKMTPIVTLGEGDLVCMHWNARSTHKDDEEECAGYRDHRGSSGGWEICGSVAKLGQGWVVGASAGDEVGVRPPRRIRNIKDQVKNPTFAPRCGERTWGTRAHRMRAQIRNT